MKLEDDQLRWRATDLSDFSACRHKTVLERDHALGRKTRPGRADPAMKLLQERGMEHEARFLQVLQERHGEVAHRVPVAPPKSADEWQSATAQTLSAMRAGHRILYQAPLALGPWSGFADFLVRRDHDAGEQASELGDYHYEVVDTKLAQEARASAVLQLCVYSEIVGTLQGRVPERFVVASPAGFDVTSAAEPREHEFRTADFGAYFRLIRERFAEFARAGDAPEPYPEPVEHCDVCAWWEHCDKRRRDDDHLSLVAGMSRSHRRLLNDADISTLTELGQLGVGSAKRPRKLPLDSFNRLQHQARLQLEAKTAPPRFELLRVEIGRGLGRLPDPSEWDVFLDMEADRYAPDGTFHYLLGWVVTGPAGKLTYEGLWATSRSEEKASFERFVDWVTARRAAHPEMHIYHFAPFEKTALGEMSLRFLSREAEVDALLRDQVLVDLMPAAKQGLRAGVESYSLKELEQFYDYTRQTDLRQAARARRLFELHRQGGRLSELPEVVPTLTEYNREDCESTLYLRGFLETQRAALIAKGERVPRPVPPEPTNLKEKKEWDLRVEELRRRLLDPIPEDIESRSATERDGLRARRLLADVLDWHWREAKPAMWDYFRQRELSSEQLLDESSTIGDVGPEEDLGKDPAPRKRVHRYRYAFPSQEYSIREGDSVACPLTRDDEEEPVKYGGVVEIDRDHNNITVERMPKKIPPPRAFIKDLDLPPIKSLQGALAEVAEALCPDFGLPNSLSTAAQDDWDSAFTDARPAFGAARALLGADTPRLSGNATLKKVGESAADALKRVAPHLDGTVLAVQGPPGAGKSHSASRMIVELVRQKKKVGICAQGHKVIENLLSKVFEAAAEANVQIFAAQKPKSGTTGLEHLNNKVVGKTEQIVPLLRSGEVQVVAGTAWVFADELLRSKLDVLVIDEAGQFSLADALAVSVAADSLILVGDPQQLAQPSQASHPEGAGASALEHLIGPEGIVAEGRGLFLESTWRLPPSIAEFTSEFYYGGKLKAHPDCARQRVDAAGPGARLSGAGIVFESVEHSGNVNHSSEEAARIVEIARALLDKSAQATWTDRAGTRSPLLPEHLMIVAPFNSQVNLIRQQLDAADFPRVRVGTVDKFQGQEAPVVIYSMTTSHPEDAPRGFEFLFSPNRFNVATSRAQALAIIVASPRLLEADCKTPKHMRLVNGLCGAVEAASRRRASA
jgi:predicted RecB family nuclease